MKSSLMAANYFLFLFSFLDLKFIIIADAYGRNSIDYHDHKVYHDHHDDHIIKKMQAFRASLLQHPPSLIASSPSSVQSSEGTNSARVYHVSSYGADPSGKTDSTEALLKVFSEVANGGSNGVLMAGISNLGGAEINFDGGDYLISQPLQFPKSRLGNIMVHGGTLHASDTFPPDRFIIELSSSLPKTETKETKASVGQKLSSSPSSYNFEYVTFKDLMLDSNFRGGGISIINSVRISIDNCYITHFSSEGIQVQGGHETLIRSSFIGQHITAGDDPGERNFSGTGITLMGNDNVVSDVVIFSASTGILVSGQANLISGVHCYNKATGFGGTGIYLKLPGLTQTRIVNSYLDYTGIVVEDPVQLTVSNTFFLGDAFITFKSVKGVVRGVNIVDNMFSGSGKGVDIVQLDGQFGNIDQVLIDRNNVDGMNLKGTIAKVAVQGNQTSWTADFNSVLLFPNLIKHVQYTLSTAGDSFPMYALRNVSDNRVTIESNVASPTSVYVMVDQGFGST